MRVLTLVWNNGLGGTLRPRPKWGLTPMVNHVRCPLVAWTYHHSVTHFPFRFWYVYDDGRNSRSHHNGLYFSSSVIFCTASYLDESSFCLIVRRMCNCSNASKSNRMWQSARMISSIIHRREMLERQCLVVFSATPPPTSTYHQPTTPGRPNVIKRTRMTPRKPNLLHICLAQRILPTTMMSTIGQT
jgi:hypothetical protein